MDSADQHTGQDVLDEGRTERSAAFREWREKWPAALAASVGTALCISLWPSVSSLFVQPLQDAFGWSRGQIAFAYNSSIVAAFAAPLFGRLIDRVGARPVVVAAMLVYAAGYLGFAMMPGSLPVYYAIFLVAATIGICTSGLGFTRIVSGEFVHSRGLALAVTRSGVGISGAFMPPILYQVISVHGWRAGFVVLAATIVLIALPVVLIATRRRGPGAASADPSPPPAGPPPGLLDLLKDSRVVLLGLAAGLSYGSVVGLLQQLQPLLVSKQMPPETASYLIGLMGVSALVGALFSGVLLDRTTPSLVGFGFTLAPALGCLLLLSEQLSYLQAISAIVLIGLAQGAELDIIGFLVARIFGLRSYASVYGFAIFTISIFSALFANLVAGLYDSFGTYSASIVICSVSFLAASGFYLLLGRSRPAAIAA